MKKRKRLTIIAIFLALLLAIPTFIATEASSTETNGLFLGGVNLDGKNIKEARRIIETEIEKWKDGKPLKLKSDYEILEISRGQFQFDIEASLNEWHERTKRRWNSFFMKPKNVDLPLHVTAHPDRSWSQRVDHDTTLERAIKVASVLGRDEIEIKYQIDPDKEVKTITESKYNVSELSDPILNHLITQFDGTSIKPKSQFSFIENAKIPKDLQKSEREIDFFATALYELTMQTNLKMIEHHSQGKIPIYGDNGIEAKVNVKQKKDLKLQNENTYAYIIKIQNKDNILTVALNTFPIKETYDYELEDRDVSKPRTVYRYSQLLKPEEEVTLQGGQDGVKVKVFRRSFDKDGNLLDRELINQASYPAVPRIILTSAKSAETNDIGDLKEVDDAIDDFKQTLDDFMYTWYPDQDDNVVNPSENQAPEESNPGKKLTPNAPIIPNMKDGKVVDLPNLDNYVDKFIEEYCEDIEEEKDEKKEDKKNQDQKKTLVEEEDNKESADKVDTDNDDPLAKLQEEIEKKKMNACKNERKELKSWLREFVMAEYLLESNRE